LGKSSALKPHAIALRRNVRETHDSCQQLKRHSQWGQRFFLMKRQKRNIASEIIADLKDIHATLAAGINLREKYKVRTFRRGFDPVTGDAPRSTPRGNVSARANARP
jgi:hypothetical protein